MPLYNRAELSSRTSFSIPRSPTLKSGLAGSGSWLSWLEDTNPHYSENEWMMPVSLCMTTLPQPSFVRSS